MQVACLTVQVLAMDKKLSLLWSMRKTCYNLIITGVFFSCIKGFDYPIFSKCRHGNALQAVCNCAG